MEFTKLPKEKQKARFEKAKALFANFKDLTYRTVEPLTDMFGDYNLGVSIQHPAFINGRALVALFDGISGKIRVYDYLKMCYGGLDFERSGNDLDVVRDQTEIENRIHQALLIISAIKELPMDIKSREQRETEHSNN